MERNLMEMIRSREEDQTYDRKGIKIKPKDIAKTIIAFANSDGGLIAYGVEDDKSIEGIDEHVRETNDIMYVPIKLCSPSVLCKFEKIQVTDKRGNNNHILLIHVPVSEKVVEDSSGDAYMRVGDKSIKMSFNERLTLTYARGEQNYEISPVFGSSIEDIDKNLVEEYMKRIGYSLSFEEFVNENDFVVNKRGELSPKAILLFGKNPQKFFARARIRFIRFDGIEELTGDQMNVIKDVEFKGRLLDQLSSAIEFVQGQIKERTFLGKDGLFVTIPEYPEFCWKELIVNAVTHRDYSITGTDIQIKMFDDRFVVESPGIFPGTVNEKNIKVTHFSRNRFIASYMKEYKYVKEFGEGIKRIYKEMAEAGLPEPSIKKVDFMTLATIRNYVGTHDGTHGGTHDGTHESEENDLIKIIKNNPYISRQQIADILGKSKRSVQRMINSNPKIRYVGSGNNGHWEIDD